MNVREVIDKGEITAVQISVLAICFMLNMLDGIDVLAVSFAAPPITDEWSLTSKAMGSVFSAGLIGMTIGAMFLASFADIIGRRNMLLVCVLTVGAGTALTGLVTSLNQLIVLRVITGLGIGAMLATLTSMVSEYMPARRRNLGINIMVGGYPLGAILGGFIAAWVIPEFGWRAMFVAFGVITALMFPIVLMMPESLQFLVQKRPKNALAKLNKVLVKLKQPVLDALPPAEEEHLTSGVRSLLTDKHRASTLLLWLAFFMTFMTLYFLYSWIPKIIVDSGLPLEKGIYTSIALNVGAIIGVLSLGYLSDKFGLASMTLIFLLGRRHDRIRLFTLDHRVAADRHLLRGCLHPGRLRRSVLGLGAHLSHRGTHHRRRLGYRRRAGRRHYRPLLRRRAHGPGLFHHRLFHYLRHTADHRRLHGLPYRQTGVLTNP